MLDKSFGVIPFTKTNNGVKFLLVKHNAGHWSFPKGHPIENELPEETAMREFREETGIDDCEIDSKNSFIERFSYEKDGKTIKRIVTLYLGEVSANNRFAHLQSKQRLLRHILPTNKIAVTPLADEIADYAWLTLGEAYERLTYDATKEVLREAQKKL